MGKCKNTLQILQRNYSAKKHARLKSRWNRRLTNHLRYRTSSINKNPDSSFFRQKEETNYVRFIHIIVQQLIASKKSRKLKLKNERLVRFVSRQWRPHFVRLSQ